MGVYVNHFKLQSKLFKNLELLEDSGASNDYKRGYYDATLCMKRVPIVNVEEVVNSWWIPAEDGDGIVCSWCETDFCTLTNETESFLYCPHCGARMDNGGHTEDV